MIYFIHNCLCLCAADIEVIVLVYNVVHVGYHVREM